MNDVTHSPRFEHQGLATSPVVDGSDVTITVIVYDAQHAVHSEVTVRGRIDMTGVSGCGRDVAGVRCVRAEAVGVSADLTAEQAAGAVRFALGSADDEVLAAWVAEQMEAA